MVRTAALVAAAVLASALAVALAVCFRSGGHSKLALLQGAARQVWRPDADGTAADNFLHAHKDDRDGLPQPEYKFSKDDGSTSFSAALAGATKKIKLLASRDEAVRKAAANRADADLSHYDAIFSKGLDEYTKISQTIDEESHKVFAKYLEPKTPPKPVYDPLSDERKIWKKMGANTDDVFGVPQEYDGWQATATAHPEKLQHLPNFVVKAQKELGGGAVAAAANGWKSKPTAAPRSHARRAHSRAHGDLQSHTTRTPGSYIAPSRKSGTSPPAASLQQPAAVDAKSLQAVIKAAVDKALKAQAASEAGTKMAAAPQNRQQGESHSASSPSSKTPIVWATAVPVDVQAIKTPRMSAAAAPPAPVAAAEDFAEPATPDAQMRGNARSWTTPSRAVVAMVERMSKRLEARKHWVSDGSEEVGVSRRHGVGEGRGGSEVVKAVSISSMRDGLVGDSEGGEIAKLKREVKKMKEEAQVERLKRQVSLLKHRLHVHHFGRPKVSRMRQLPEGSHHARARTHVLSDAGDTDLEDAGGNAEEGAEGQEGQESQDNSGEVGGEEGREKGGGVGGEGDGEVKEQVYDMRKLRVCDGFGCRTQVMKPAQLPHVQSPDAEGGIKEQLEGKGIMDALFPDPHTWESEVHLNAKGQIRADHDDPNGRLMPHNKFQHAEYPEEEGGDAHIRRDPADERPGLTNQVGNRLFSDAIVEAAPGFNAGTGRHTRAQEAATYGRPAGDPVVIGRR